MFNKIRTLFRVPIWWWHLLALDKLTRPVPAGVYISNVIAQRLLGNNYKADFMVHFTSQVGSPDKIVLPDTLEPRLSFATSGGCYIQAMNGVEFGENTIFGPGIKIISANHDMTGGTSSWLEQPPVRIGRDCWLGANCVVLPGVDLGDNSIVAAGAVVTRSFPANSVLAGVPAKTMVTHE